MKGQSAPILLQRKRKKLGWSYRTLAEKSGLPVATVFACLTQKFDSSFITVVTLATALGMRLSVTSIGKKP